ncbi:hypothetical protein ACIQBJ_05365 [Kitasatospora sp. NPDC088391]|uniref:hypothetical protein n=1 Tax=Kitasatospora sp. NPDC088391 TaxID=3364074 RepID=UPI00381009F4
MGTSTGGNGSQAGAGGVQLPSVAWEIEEGSGGAAGSGAPSYGQVEPAAAQPAASAPKYGRVLPDPNAVRRPAAPPAAEPQPAAARPGPAAEAQAEAEGDDRRAPRPPRTPAGVFPFLSPEQEPATAPMPDPTAGGFDGDDPDGADGEEEPERRRSRKPMVLAAVTAGVLLLGLPFVLTDSGPKTTNTSAGQADQPPAGGPELGDLLPTPGPNDPTAVPAPVDAALLPGGSAAPTSTDPAAAGTAGGTGTGGSTGGTTGGGSAAGGGTGGTGGGTGGGSTSGGSGTGGTSGGSGTTGGTTTGGGAPVVPAPNKTTAPAAPSFSAVAGTGCTNAGTGYDQNGWYTEGSTGWTSSSTGGYAGSGCSGKYVSLPMSGNASKDAGKSVLWAFTTNPVPSGTCRISVYIPNNGDVKAVGGKPAYYTVQRYFTTGEGTISAFTIDQTANRGKWVNAGTFPATNGKIAVMLHDRGIDFGSGAEQAHHAASAVRADCS